MCLRTPGLYLMLVSHYELSDTFSEQITMDFQNATPSILSLPPCHQLQDRGSEICLIVWPIHYIKISFFVDSKNANISDWGIHGRHEHV